MAKADALADEIAVVLKTQLRSADGDDLHEGRVEERRIKEVHTKEAGPDDRTEQSGSLAVDDCPVGAPG